MGIIDVVVVVGPRRGIDRIDPKIRKLKEFSLPASTISLQNISLAFGHEFRNPDHISHQWRATIKRAAGHAHAEGDRTNEIKAHHRQSLLKGQRI
jgi:hypothetical protein